MIVVFRLILYLVFCGYSLVSPDTTFTFFPFALFFAQVALDILESGNNLYSKMKISPIIAKVVGVITLLYAIAFFVATFFYTINTEVVDCFCLEAKSFTNLPFTLPDIAYSSYCELVIYSTLFFIIAYLFINIFNQKNKKSNKSFQDHVD